jgi:diguanylate cyclase (GGDEF)-like protein
VHPDDREHMQQLVQQSIDTGQNYAGDFRMQHKDGHWVWIHGSGGVVEYDENGLATRLCGIHQEISDRKSLESQLEFHASYDALTGLLNRRELLERLETEVSRAQRHDQPLVIFLLDIDHFKRINDTLGHKAGDRVLQGFAAMLNGHLRKMDLCGRYGGEEFIVALPETELHKAVGLAERLRSLIENNDRLAHGLRLSITVSIGISAYPADGSNVAELIDAADKALYRAKNGGRNLIATATDPA